MAPRKDGRRKEKQYITGVGIAYIANYTCEHVGNFMMKILLACQLPNKLAELHDLIERKVTYTLATPDILHVHM